jgi:hypothetical protein
MVKTYRVKITTIEYGELEAEDSELDELLKLPDDQLAVAVDDGATWGYGRYKIAEIKVDGVWQVLGKPQENIHD